MKDLKSLKMIKLMAKLIAKEANKNYLVKKYNKNSLKI